MSEYRCIGSFSKQVKRVNDANNSGADVYSVTKYDGFVRSLDYFKKQVFSRDLSAYKIVKKGEFAYSTIHLDEGALGLLADEEALISPMYTTFEIDGSVDRSYLSYLLKSPDLINQYGLIGQGSVNRRKSVPFSSLAEIEVYIPPLPEQKKIAEILSGIDTQRQALAKKVANASMLRNALGEKIFSSLDGERVALGELCNPKQWQTISSDQLTTSGYPVYGANGKIGYFSEYNHKEPVLAVTCRGATCGNLTLIPAFSYVTGNSMCLDNPRKDTSPEYLFQFLAWRGLRDVISGSAQPQITRSPLQVVEIILPSKEKQDKIVSALQSVNNTEHIVNIALSRLDILKQAIAADLLSGRKRVSV